MSRVRESVYFCVVGDWSENASKRIGEAIKAARQRGKLSAQDLADRTTHLNHAVSRNQIANIESGRKQSIEVAELLILAAALRVSPSDLLFPTLPDGEVEVLPGVMATSWDAYQWVTGESDKTAETAGEGLVALARTRESVVDAMRRNFMQVTLGSPPSGIPLAEGAKPLPPAVRAALDAEFDALDKQLAALDARIIALGGVVVDDTNGGGNA